MFIYLCHFIEFLAQWMMMRSTSLLLTIHPFICFVIAFCPLKLSLSSKHFIRGKKMRGITDLLRWWFFGRVSVSHSVTLVLLVKRKCLVDITNCWEAQATLSLDLPGGQCSVALALSEESRMSCHVRETIVILFPSVNIASFLSSSWSLCTTAY